MAESGNHDRGSKTPPTLQAEKEDEEAAATDRSEKPKNTNSKVFTDVLFPDDSDDDGADIFQEKKRTDSLLVATSGDFEPLTGEKENIVSFTRKSDKQDGRDDEDDIGRTHLSFKEKNLAAPTDNLKKETKGYAAVVCTSSIENAKKNSNISLEGTDLIEIIVSDARKIGDGMNAYVAYKVSTKTNSKLFVRQELSVARRFSDFLGLYEKLVASHQYLGRIVPMPPEKDMLSMTRVKMTKEETGSMEFVERRRAALERFLMRIARHPLLGCDQDFIEFLQVEGELPRVSGVSILSGAGIAKLIGKVGDSINKMTYTLPEFDHWYEDRNEQMDVLEHYLQELHVCSELLVLQRKDLAQSTNLLSRGVANMGSTEEDLPLSRVMSSLAENFNKVEKIHLDQSDLDFYSISELFKDNLQMISGVRAVFNERVKAHKHWKDAELILQKKKDAKVKLEAQKKTDKLEFASMEITEWEERVAEGGNKFEELSETIKKEVVRLDVMSARDYKVIFINYLQSMANYQQQVLDIWESFLPEVKHIN